MPSLSALRSFEAAARHGSFKAAAAELGVTPTAISHQIRMLEDRLGLALFLRGTRRVTLTPSGGHLAEAAGDAFTRLAEAVAAIAEVERVLTIATTPALASLWLVPRLIEFEALHPEIELHVETGTVPVDLQRDRRIDLALRYGPAAEAGTGELVRHEHFTAFAAPELLANGAGLARARLLETRWRRQGPAVGWVEWAAAAGLEAEAVAGRVRRFDQEHHVVQAGLAGQGFILMSDILAADAVARGWLIPYRPEIRLPGAAYRLIHPPHRAPTTKTRRFTRWLESRLIN